MKLSPVSWRCHVFFLLCEISYLLPPAGCNFFESLGSLTVKPAATFLMGTNLTVYCHTYKCPHQSELYLYIKIKNNDKKVSPWKIYNCSATFALTNVREPQSTVYCMKKDSGAVSYVRGLSLYSGFPPDKPHNISCETTRSSHSIDCKWERGKDTYVVTTYNISVNVQNGSRIYSNHIQDEVNCSIPRAIFDENTTYNLTIIAHNHFGQSQSKPLIFLLKDIVIPEVPHITHTDFENGSLTATLHWKTNESSKSLQPFIRMRTANNQWAEAEVLEVAEGLVQVFRLKPLKDYEFQLKTCDKALRPSHTSPPSVRKAVCSKWSASYWKKSPGQAPSKPLHVWRDTGIKVENGQQMVTVFWKPLHADDYSGEVLWYEILYGAGHRQVINCPAMSSTCSVRVPQLKPISVRAVTLYGTTPPAHVPLTLSDAPCPLLKEVTPAVNGRAVFLSWAGHEQIEEVLNYVIEWTTLPPKALRWQTLSKDHNNATITGLTAGVRYNISLYTVTTRGVSAPSSSVVYSQELKPICGPVISVLVHESKQVLVTWDELPLKQRRGFITSYNIYYYVIDSSKSKFHVTIPSSAPREMRLDCPEGALALQMTASTSAGEGPLGNLISSHPATPPVGLVIVVIFIITLFIAIIVNLMCWKCVRKRIKQKCIAWGPAWLGDNLPKLNNSNAIKLLELDRSEPSLLSSYNDPPLSPISLLSEEEREDIYPCVHVKLQTKTHSHAHAEELITENTTENLNSSMEHTGYKPQAFTFFEEEEEETEIGDQTSSGLVGDILGGLLPNVQMDVSDFQVDFSLHSVPRLWWAKNYETNVDSIEKMTIESKMDVKVDLMHVPAKDASSDDDALVDLSDNDEEVTGYFPQI